MAGGLGGLLVGERGAGVNVVIINESGLRRWQNLSLLDKKSLVVGLVGASSLCPAIPNVPDMGDSPRPENSCCHHVAISPPLPGRQMGLTDCNYCLLFFSKVHQDLRVPSGRRGKATCEVRKYPPSSALFRNQACLGYQCSTTCAWEPKITVTQTQEKSISPSH